MIILSFRDTYAELDLQDKPELEEQTDLSNESKAQPFEPDLEKAYNMFSDSYIKSTGKTWDKEKFMQRSQNWNFYGDENGYVAVRPQMSGYVKLVGCAGNVKSILKGMKQIETLHLPIWGAMSGKLASMAEGMGYIRPPAWVMKKVFPIIGKSLFSGNDFKINDDGSVTVQYGDVGEATKYFVASKEYFKKLLENFMNNPPKMPKIILNQIIKVIKNLIGI